MPMLRDQVEKMLANGRIDEHEVAVLEREILANQAVSTAEAELLVGLYRRVQQMTPCFEKFFCKAMKRYLLADGVITPAKAAWLRGIVFADGRVTDRERKLVREIKGEAAGVCPEFEALLKDVAQ